MEATDGEGLSYIAGGNASFKLAVDAGGRCQQAIGLYVGQAGTGWDSTQSK